MLHATIATDRASRRAGRTMSFRSAGKRSPSEDHAVWDLLFARQVDLLGSRVVSPFLHGIDLLRLSHPGVPELAELNAILEPRTGWRTVAVPGLVPDAIFFAMLGERVFPVGNFIRTREQLDYLEAPDCFHDLFGHIPMLAHHDFAEMARAYRKPRHRGDRRRQGRLVRRGSIWHSVEFGLAREHGELKILGAGPRLQLRRIPFQPGKRRGRTAALLRRPRGPHALPARRVPTALSRLAIARADGRGGAGADAGDELLAL